MSASRLTLQSKGFTLVEVMIVVVILGILAVVAIPAFIKYIRYAKTSEAKENLAYLFRESTTYFAKERVARGVGAPLISHTFPASAGPNPPVPPAGTKTTTTWDHPTWQALSFGLADPHYYSYTYESSGHGVGALFTARASGDLDGDAIVSIFERAGVADAQLTVRGSRGLFEQNPLE